MYIKQEEYLPLAKDLMVSFTRDLADFTSEDHNYTQVYKDAFQGKISEIENKEASDTALVQQKQMTQDLLSLGRKPQKTIEKFTNTY